MIHLKNVRQVKKNQVQKKYQNKQREYKIIVRLKIWKKGEYNGCKLSKKSQHGQGPIKSKTS